MIYLSTTDYRYYEKSITSNNYCPSLISGYLICLYDFANKNLNITSYEYIYLRRKYAKCIGIFIEWIRSL